MKIVIFEALMVDKDNEGRLEMEVIVPVAVVLEIDESNQKITKCEVVE